MGLLFSEGELHILEFISPYFISLCIRILIFVYFIPISFSSSSLSHPSLALSPTCSPTLLLSLSRSLCLALNPLLLSILSYSPTLLLSYPLALPLSCSITLCLALSFSLFHPSFALSLSFSVWLSLLPSRSFFSCSLTLDLPLYPSFSPTLSHSHSIINVFTC